MVMPVSARFRTLAPAVALIVTAGLVLAGCASGEAPAGTGTAAPKANVVKTLYGDVTVPANPKRIVALDFPEATALADIGIKPVGIGGYEPNLPAYNTFFKGIPNLTDDNGLPVAEKVAAVKPDLIILDDFADQIEKDRPTYEKLSAIAPTVVFLWTQAAGSWQEDAAGTAQAVGKVAELNRLKAAYNAHAADIKKQYAEVLATHTIDLVSGDANTWYLYGPTSSHGRVLVQAGARLGAAKDQKLGFVAYSTEKYNLLRDTSAIIVSAGNAKQAAPVTSSPVFAGLGAAKNDAVFTSSRFFPSSYRIANALLDDFAADLKKLG